MAILKEQDQDFLKNKFSELEQAVKLTCFTQQFECQNCEQTRSLLEEVSQLSDKISLQVYDFQKDQDKAKNYGIDKIPAVAVEGKKDYGIRYYGIPGGYEFTSLIESIMNVSSEKTDLAPDTLQKLNSLNQPVHIQVFVTPT